MYNKQASNKFHCNEYMLKRYDITELLSYYSNDWVIWLEMFCQKTAENKVWMFESLIQKLKRDNYQTLNKVYVTLQKRVFSAKKVCTETKT